MSLIDACGSATHRALLRLTGVALGAPVSQALLADLAAADPIALAGVANVHHLHCLLSAAQGREAALDAALPADLWLYFSEMTQANAHRVALGQDQLRWLGGQFHAAGLCAVVLKGGAGMLDPQGMRRAHRFVSDLDLLFADFAQAKAGYDLLMSLGGISEAYDPKTLQAVFHHFPTVTMPDQEFPIEVHFRTGAPPVATALPAGALVAAAQPSEIPGLLLPNMRDRYVHHVVHSAYAYHDRQAFFLRALINHQAYAASDRALGQAPLAAVGATRHDEILTGLEDLVMGRDDTASVMAQRVWLRRALRGFGKAGQQRLRGALLETTEMVRRLITLPAYRRHVVSTLCNGAARREMLRAKWRKVMRIR